MKGERWLRFPNSRSGFDGVLARAGLEWNHRPRFGVEQESAQRRGSSPDNVYYVYVGAESADLLHRIRFGPDGAEVEQTTVVGEMSLETEGPHGLMTSPDGRFLYMTTGHGIPDGKLWKLETGADTLVAEPIL